MTLLPILGLLGPFISPMWYPATRAFAIHCSKQVQPLPQPNLTKYECDIPDFEMDSNFLQLSHIIFAHQDLFDWNFCTIWSVSIIFKMRFANFAEIPADLHIATS